MNILLVADVSIKDVIGGAERALHEHSVGLVKKGHTVYILTRKLPSHSSSDEMIEGVHEYRYDVDQSHSAAFLISTIVNAQKLFKELSAKARLDIINFHQPFTAFAINLLPGYDHINKTYTCHSLSFEEYISRHKPSGFSLNVHFRKFMEKFSLDKSSKIIVLSEFTKEKLIRNHSISASKIAIIPGSVDINHFKPAGKKDISTPPLVLFTARNLTPRMGLENLIKAIPLLLEKGINVKLNIGGHGQLREKLESMVKTLDLQDSVTLCGFLSKEELLRHYQTSHFFILPTVELEGFGLVTIESMACGTPALVTPIGGSLEILGKFDKSFIFKDTSAESIAALILEKYEHFRNKPDEYLQLCEDLRLFAKQNYSNEKIVDLLEDFYVRNMR
jgi:glycosyltransferase involved in cell wall biosynthesis